MSSNVQSDRNSPAWWWLRWLQVCASLMLALLALFAGVSIPSHFRSISPLVLEAANAGTPSMADYTDELLHQGKPGPASALIRLLEPKDPRTQALAASRDRLLERHPQYLWSGGPAPFYEVFLQQAPQLNPKQPAVLPALLPAANRLSLLGFLNNSPNQRVLDILRVRELSGWQLFSPVFSSSGQPLDAALLCTALLEQSSAFRHGLRTDLQRMVDAALHPRQASLTTLEPFLAALLAVGRHADWLQLSAFIAAMPDRDAVLFYSAALQQDPDRLDLLLSAFTLAADPLELQSYLTRHPEHGWKAVDTALSMGQGALQSLIATGKPLYHPPAIWYRLPASWRNAQSYAKGFSEALPTLALALRGACFAVCGFFIVGLLRGILLGSRRRGRRGRMLWQLDRAVGSLLVMLLLWIAIEPAILEFAPNESGVLQIQLAQLMPNPPSITDSNDTSNMIDQVTIIVLLLFLVLQLFVFIFGLLKLGEIRRQPVSAETKIKLLDNEEVLFDLGLYVGLGGTVGSLIMIVLNFVDASLMAAYASTLFGIIFVGLLKVGYLRPFRRRLLLESSAVTFAEPATNPAVPDRE